MKVGAFGPLENGGNQSNGVWPTSRGGDYLQIEEELGDDVKGQEAVARKLVICETDNAEEDG